jgi:hypothetical protein
VSLAPEQYDAFEHLAAALFWEPEDLVAILIPDATPPTLYCDASKTSAGHTVVAGAVASTDDWKGFNKEWTAALTDNHLKYFRMSEFAHSTGQFAKGWKRNEERRRAFLERLIKIIVRHVKCWTGVCVSPEDYKAADEVYELHEYLQPYALCGLTCVEIAHEWKSWQHHLDHIPMEYIFECGDDYADQLRKAVRAEFGKEPIFRPKLPNEKCPNDRPLTPLQVGDFAAYELGKFFGLIDDASELFVRFRTSFGLLGVVGHKWGYLEADKIRAELNNRDIPKRLTKKE